MPSKPLRCRLGRHHWVLRYAEDGASKFHQCTRCQKVRNPDGWIPPGGLIG